MASCNQFVPQSKITGWSKVIVVGRNEVVVVGRGNNVDAGFQPVFLKDPHRFYARLTESVIEAERDYVCLLPLGGCGKSRESHTLQKAPAGDRI